MRWKEIVDDLAEAGYELMVEPLGDGKVLLVNRRRRETVALDVAKWSKAEWDRVF